jgi:hypothetical protein
VGRGISVNGSICRLVYCHLHRWLAPQGVVFMNERIQEFILQATETTDVYNPDTGITHYREFFDHEKFAELIVQECYETIKKDMELAHIQLIPIDFGIYANSRLRRIIKEHFGIKE